MAIDRPYGTGRRVDTGPNPFLLAKELAQLDQISHGRLLLSFVTGIGAPWTPGPSEGATHPSRLMGWPSTTTIGRQVRGLSFPTARIAGARKGR